MIFQNTRCSACKVGLTTPSIHFLCRHSYHAKCLQDENSCVVCEPEYEFIKEMEEMQKGNADAESAEYFIEEIKRRKGEDRMEYIVELFGKGLF